MKNSHLQITGEAKFAAWLEQASPKLAYAFDWKARKYDKYAVEQLMEVADDSTISFIQFVLGVWHHENRFNFDLINATPILSLAHHSAIAAWFNEPFWP